VQQLTVLDDALTGLRLAALRDATTPPERFRAHARALGSLLAREALRELPTRTAEVTGPLGPATARVPAAPVVAVPVLRAGLGLLPGIHDLVPDATVGLIGLERDPESLRARRYYANVPPLEGAWVLLLEPMLATGGSAADALDELDLPRAARVAVLAVVATRQAVDLVAARHPDVGIVTAALDPRLDDDGYIVPGLGDFGDRVLGTPHA
jgi:uracil phosphoribosyltransferase